MRNIIYKHSSIVTAMSNTLKIAIEGCCHGELNDIYNSIPDIESLDLLLICGDFQSLRNKCDLQSLNVPSNINEWQISMNIIVVNVKHPY